MGIRLKKLSSSVNDNFKVKIHPHRDSQRQFLTVLLQKIWQKEGLNLVPPNGCSSAMPGP